MSALLERRDRANLPCPPFRGCCCHQELTKHLISLEPEVVLVYQYKLLQNNIVQLNTLPSVFGVLDHSKDLVMYLETQILSSF